MTYLDVGAPDATVFVSGMGRSGTTWLVDLINHRFSHRVIFEPFRTDIVAAARVFGPFAYIRPTDSDPVRRRAAARILAGRVRRGHVDRMHRGFIFRRRIVKAVRSNLMLSWLKTVLPTMPVVLIIRHPLAVASSWQRLGWGQVPGSSQLELDVIVSQDELLADFPIITRAIQHVDRSSVFERAITEWCVTHLVPLEQMRGGAAHVVFFEDLVLKPEATFAPLASYVGVDVDWAAFHRAFDIAAETDFLQRGNRADREQLLGDWRQHLSAAQIDRGREIVAAFGLDHLYDAQGRPVGLTPLPSGS